MRLSKNLIANYQLQLSNNFIADKLPCRGIQWGILRDILLLRDILFSDNVNELKLKPLECQPIVPLEQLLHRQPLLQGGWSDSDVFQTLGKANLGPLESVTIRQQAEPELYRQSKAQHRPQRVW